MRKSIILLVILSLCCYYGNAQSSIKGTISDTINKQQLQHTSIVLLSAKDSLLVKFARSSKDGKFELPNIAAGDYVAMITYPGYADYFDKVKVETGKSTDLGTVSMTLKSRLLQEVFVKQTIAAIKLKGDTVEYKADSFRVREGASVEEMLKKLPGLQVDKDGNITAHGTKVEKVLVDGEEFFGDDPTMATKNLQASSIDKVQVFDKKSDQAVFTGIDDGTKIKTINLTMKDDKKKGYFGKLELAGGLDNRWSNNAMMNSFTAKRKLSMYGIMSSTGKTGLNWQESEKFGGNNGMQYDADGGFFYSFSSGDDFEGGGGSFYGQGIPISWSAGTQYSNKFNKDKQNINGSYRYNKLNTSGGGNTITQSILPDTVFYNRANRNFYNSKQRHSANATYEYQIDSFTSLKIAFNGYRGDLRSVTTSGSAAMNEAGNLINRSNSISNSSGDNKSFNSNFLLRKRFKKPGRTISLSFEEQYRFNESEGTLFAINDFYDKTGSRFLVDTIDQKKMNEVMNSGYYTRVAYTEPVVKNVFVELSYGMRVSNSESKKLSYDKSVHEKYDVLNDTFSNHYKFNVKTNSGGMTWRYNGKKLTISAGGDIAKADFSQRDVLHDTLLQYNYTNLFPRANFTYKFNSNSRVSLNYNGSTRQPSIEQLQPVRDNTNPLNIAIGNADLKQEFRQTFSFNFNAFKVLKQRGFYSYGNFTTISNAITNSDFTFPTGQRVTQYINVDGNYTANGGGGYNIKVKKLDVNFNAGININMNHYNSIVNGRANQTDNNAFGINIGIYKFKEKKFETSINTNIRYNENRSSIRPDVKTNYIIQNHNFNLTVTLPARFEINTSVEATLRQKTTAFDNNNNMVLINGYFGKKLFKNDQGLIKLQAYDVLNQNRGFNRFTNSNILREDTYESLSRYFLLSFIWNFTKTPGGAAPKK
jgi:hypothetical protein